MRFDQLDLNLLVALDVLIEERSVSAAARHLNLSQPAVTGALNRLRQFFGDELLVKYGREMLLTPKAEELARPVRRALTQIRTEITRPSGFDPATSDRHFVVVASDYVFSTVLARAVATAAELAPHVTFEVAHVDRLTSERLERAEADLVITLGTYVDPQHPRLALFEDEEVVVAWSGANYGSVDEHLFFSAGHAAAVFGRDRHPSSVDDYLSSQPRQRRIEISVPSFAALPLAVVGTRRLALMHRRLAEHFSALYPLSTYPAPVALPRIEQIAQWHRLRDKDAGVQWLVDLVRRTARQLG